MTCKKCGAPIPYKAKKCNNCYQETGYRLGESSFPDFDMFEQQIFEVETDRHKEETRHRYLQTLPEFVQIKQIKKESMINILKFILLIFLCTPVLGFSILLVVFACINDSALAVPFILILAIGFIIFSIFIVKKMIKKGKPKQQYRKSIELHENKLRYYVNNYIFGFSVLDHTTHDNDTGTDYYYAFYEVEKRNIKGISYDPYYAEYILHLYKPVYVHYDFEPTVEFRIADVFDDVILSNALNSDLPAKKIPY